MSSNNSSNNDNRTVEQLEQASKDWIVSQAERAGWTTVKTIAPPATQPLLEISQRIKQSLDAYSSYNSSNSGNLARSIGSSI